VRIFYYVIQLCCILSKTEFVFYDFVGIVVANDEKYEGTELVDI